MKTAFHEAPSLLPIPGAAMSLIAVLRLALREEDEKALKWPDFGVIQQSLCEAE